MGGFRCSCTLSVAGIVEASASHFSTRLDAEIYKVPCMLSVGIYDFAMWAELCHKSGGR